MESTPLRAGGRRLNRRKAKTSLRALMELGKLYAGGSQIHILTKIF